MRAASDLHLATHTAGWVFQALADLRADAEQYGGATILAGDLFDQPKSVDMPLYNQLRDVLRSFPDKVYILPGNHDQYDGWRNACEALAIQHKVLVASQPTEYLGIGLLVPHMSPAGWLDVVREERPKRVPLVFAHQGFKGSYLNSMVRDRTGIRVSDLDGLVVVSGHYHMPQNVAQVVYCGSPYQTTHAETGQTKGFLVWRDRPRSSWVDWIPERVGYASVTAPRYWTVRWDGEGDPKLPEGHREGDIVRIVTRLAPDEVSGSLLKRVGLQGAAIVASKRATPRIDVSGLHGPEEALERYLIASRRDGVDPTDLRAFMAEEDLWPGA
jgi:Calcineurin-like phosphoesterase superfamily domain